MGDRHKINMRMKSGKEFNFSCESYKWQVLLGELTSVTFTGATGECPVYYRPEDVESISEYIEEDADAD